MARADSRSSLRSSLERSPLRSSLERSQFALLAFHWLTPASSINTHSSNSILSINRSPFLQTQYFIPLTLSLHSCFPPLGAGLGASPQDNQNADALSIPYGTHELGSRTLRDTVEEAEAADGECWFTCQYISGLVGFEGTGASGSANIRSGALCCRLTWIRALVACIAGRRSDIAGMSLQGKTMERIRRRSLNTAYRWTRRSRKDVRLRGTHRWSGSQLSGIQCKRRCGSGEGRGKGVRQGRQKLRMALRSATSLRLKQGGIPVAQKRVRRAR